jgi:acid phosphatase family membrane protein YuiD
MTGTAAGVGWYQGYQDPLFALAAAVTFVVLYDASGVRRAAGATAARVNAMVSGREPGHEVGGEVWQHPLKENIGHTRLEVLVGSLLGPLVALPGLALVGSPLHLASLLSHGLPAAVG